MCQYLNLFACLTFFSMVPLCVTAQEVAAQGYFLKDGERVVLLGNTLIEREQTYGDWELQLTLAAGERKVTFRNLGWSGDTVWAESRGLFDPPAVGYQRTMELVRELKPTTIIFGYGSVESSRGPEGLAEFTAQYQKLRSDLLATNARLVHLSPLYLEASSFPKLAEGVDEHVEKTNENIELYATAIHSIAKEADEVFVNFRAYQLFRGDPVPLMENGVHLSEFGYQRMAAMLVGQLGGKITPGAHAELKGMIQRKNELFFHRWRPQNFTYLLGFRKHEQGNNAVEIAQFDPLIEELETQIHALKLKTLNE